MPIINYMNSTMPLQWAHLAASRSFKSAIDCLHYCRPGIPEVRASHCDDMPSWQLRWCSQKNSLSAHLK